MTPRNHQWFISESKTKKRDAKIRLPDPALGSSMSSNMPGIKSYFPWQKSGLLSKQTERENHWHALSWLLISFEYHLFPEASGQCEEKGEWLMENHGEKWQAWCPLMSVWSHQPQGGDMSVSVCYFLSVRVCAWWKYQVNLRCCWTEEQTSGTLYSYHPIKYINIHVIWCPIVGQPYTTNFCFALPPLASLIR